MFLPRAEYDRLVRQLETAQLALELERAENRRAERWQMNMLLRRAKSFPLPEKPSVTEPVTEDNTVAPTDIDPGELEALQEVGAQYGIDAAEVEEMLKRERGIEP